VDKFLASKSHFVDIFFIGYSAFPLEPEELLFRNGAFGKNIY